MAHNASKFEEVLFVDQSKVWVVTPGDRDGVDGPFPLPGSGSSESASLESALPKSTSLAIVLPDEWAKEEWVPFQGTKVSLMRAYAERILKRQLAQTPKLVPFHDLRKYTRGSERGFLMASVIEAAFIGIWEAVRKTGSQVTLISTPGFLLKEWFLRSGLSTSEHGVFVMLEQSGVFSLWALNGDRLAFCRSLKPPSAEDPEKNAQYIAYELRQSLFYFAQQEKVPVKRLYLVGEFSSRNWEEGLAQDLGIEISDLPLPETYRLERFDLNHGGHLLPFLSLLRLGTARNLPVNLLPAPLKRELIQRPWVRAGIAAGIFVWIGIGVLLALFTYHAHREKSLWQPDWETRVEEAHQRMETLSRLSQWATEFYERPGAGHFVYRVSRLLKDKDADAEIVDMDITFGSSTKVRMKAALRAENASDLEARLRALILRLSALDPELTKKDIAHFPLEPADAAEGQRRYLFDLELSSPWLNIGSS